MPANRSSHHSAPVWGIFLVFLGVVFLLQTTGVLPRGLWQTLGGLWPVLIIVVGLTILLRHINVWLVSLLIAAIFGATLGLAISQYHALPVGALTTLYSQPISGIEGATVDLELNASNVIVESLPIDSTNLVEVSSTLNNVKDALDTTLDQSGSEARLSLIIKPSGAQLGNIRWVVRLAQKIPLDLTLTANASNAKLIFSDATFSALQLEGNASNIDASLAAPAPMMTVNTSVKANASNIVLTIPQGTHAAIQVHSNLSTVDVAKRFVSGPDSPKSSSGTGSSYTITVDANVSRVQVR